MTQEDINITPTFIKYDQDVLVDKLNQQMDTLMGLQYKFATHTYKDYHKKYLRAVLQNIQTICQCFYEHELVKKEEIEEINEKIKIIISMVKSQENAIPTFVNIYISELIDIIFLLDIYNDEDAEEGDVTDIDDDEEDEDIDEEKIEEELNNKVASDHASIINIENEHKKRKCNEQ